MEQSLTLVLDGAAIALSLLAIFLSWNMYQRSSELQTKAQKALDKMIEKMEVVSQHTAKQVDKAWEYITRSEPDGNAVAKMEENFQQQLKEERAEILEQVKNLSAKTNLEIEFRQELEQKVNLLADSGSNAVSVVKDMSELEYLYKDLSGLVRLWFETYARNLPINIKSFSFVDRVLFILEEIGHTMSARDVSILHDTDALLTQPKYTPIDGTAKNLAMDQRIMFIRAIVSLIQHSLMSMKNMQLR